MAAHGYLPREIGVPADELFRAFERGVRIRGAREAHRVENTRNFERGTGNFLWEVWVASPENTRSGYDRRGGVDDRRMPLSTAQPASCVRDVNPSFARALAT